MIEIRLPAIGEGIAEGEIIEWRVAPGDAVSQDQILLEVLTDKASVEIPSPQAGVVAELLFSPGDLVPVGSVIVRLHQAHPVNTAALTPATASLQTPEIPPAAVAGEGVMATPAVRQRARELGVDLTQIQGSGPFGRITLEDLEQGSALLSTSPAVSVAAPASVVVSVPEVPATLAMRSTEERIPLRGIRRKIAEQMVRAKFTAPDFLYADEVDLTELVAFRQEVAPALKQAGIKLTYLPFVIKAVASALKAYPTLNASLEEDTQELILKRYYHLGVATASPQGLLVPVIRDADRLSIRELAQEIERLSAAVREGRAKAEELRGSTFTITNIGAIGGLISAPIINYPEVAILAFNKIYQKPVVWQGEIVPRWVCTFSLSVDHRVVDGADAAYFLRHIQQLLENPKRLLLE